MIPIKDSIPTNRFPVVTFLLIVANVVVYLLATRHGGTIVGGPDAGGAQGRDGSSPSSRASSAAAGPGRANR